MIKMDFIASLVRVSLFFRHILVETHSPLSMSLSFQPKITKFYNEMKDKTLPKYYKVVSTSFAISISIFALIASIGFLTFGSNSSGLILNNYSTRDGLMNLSIIAVAI
jgi:amino acid permease